MKMTIHRGLSELKTLKARISKAIEETNLINLTQTGKKVAGQFTEEEFTNLVKGEYDSVTALIERQRSIKQAIVSSNAVTEVRVGSATMKVADAITMKDLLENKKLLVLRLQSQLTHALSVLNKNNDNVAANCQKILEHTFGSDRSKISKDDIDSVQQPFMANNEFHLVDPLKLNEKIKDLKVEIAEFETNVDAALSESNAVTFIEVTD